MSGNAPLVISSRSFSSRLMLGTGKFASGELMRAAIEASGTEIVTVALRRADLDAVVEATLDPQSGRPWLEVLSERCGETLRIEKLELFDQQSAVVVVEQLDREQRRELFGARGVVLAQWFYQNF